MSKSLQIQLYKYPLITEYAKLGLINLMALARIIDPEKKKGSVEAKSMELRRYFSKAENQTTRIIDFSNYTLQITARTGIREIILRKSHNHFQKSLDITKKISDQGYFSSVIQGERECVIITDIPAQELNKLADQKLILHQKTEDLTFISINLPLELRKEIGVYSLITSALASKNISIQAFHTLGGEVIILLKQSELIRAQETLSSLFD